MVNDVGTMWNLLEILYTDRDVLLSLATILANFQTAIAHSTESYWLHTLQPANSSRLLRVTYALSSRITSLSFTPGTGALTLVPPTNKNTSLALSATPSFDSNSLSLQELRSTSDSPPLWCKVSTGHPCPFLQPHTPPRGLQSTTPTCQSVSPSVRPSISQSVIQSVMAVSQSVA